MDFLVENKRKSWSSGQRARFLFRQSEFESRWSLTVLSVQKLFKKDKNKQKEAGV